MFLSYSSTGKIIFHPLIILSQPRLNCYMYIYSASFHILPILFIHNNSVIWCRVTSACNKAVLQKWTGPITWFEMAENVENIHFVGCYQILLTLWSWALLKKGWQFLFGNHTGLILYSLLEWRYTACFNQTYMQNP